MTKELEPCPFHKERVLPELYHGANEMQGNWARVECPVCGVSIEAEGIGPQIPIVTDLWNTRYKRTCKWETKKSGTLYDVYQCSECGYEYAESRTDKGIKVEICDAKFCPNCGAEVADGDKL